MNNDPRVIAWYYLKCVERVGGHDYSIVGSIIESQCVIFH